MIDKALIIVGVSLALLFAIESLTPDTKKMEELNCALSGADICLVGGEYDAGEY